MNIINAPSLTLIDPKVFLKIFAKIFLLYLSVISNNRLSILLAM